MTKNFSKVIFFFFFFTFGSWRARGEDLQECLLDNVQAIQNLVKSYFSSSEPPHDFLRSQVVLIGDSCHYESGQKILRRQLINLLETHGQLKHELEDKKKPKSIVLFEFADSSTVIPPEHFATHEHTRGLCPDLVVGHWDNAELRFQALEDLFTRNLYDVQKVIVQRNENMLEVLKTLRQSGLSFDRIYIIAGDNHFNYAQNLPDSGNIREKNKLLWRDTSFFLENNTRQLCNFLKQDEDPKLVAPFIHTLREYCQNQDYIDRGFFTANAKRYKKNVDKMTGNKIISQLAPTPEQMKIPLSYRERAFLQARPQDPSLFFEESGTEKIFFNMGMALSQMLPDQEINDPQDPQKIFLRTARALGLRTLVSPSGSTDQLLSIAQVLGITSRRELDALRLGLIGFYVNSHHHSVYEVLVGSLSFPQLSPIHFGPEYYKDLYPSDPQFTKEVEDAYRLRTQGKKLPAEILAQCMQEKNPGLGARFLSFGLFCKEKHKSGH